MQTVFAAPTTDMHLTRNPLTPFESSASSKEVAFSPLSTSFQDTENRRQPNAKLDFYRHFTEIGLQPPWNMRKQLLK
jgi:hypothetical protein